MKLKTSFFNATVLKKDLTRFAPIWVLYGIFSLLFLLLTWNGNASTARFAYDIPDIMQSMGIFNLLYGGLCAFFLFGDLFSSRLCNALHAMPLRREGWFLTHLCAGMLFCLIPNLLVTAAAAVLLQEFCYLAFLWLALMLLQYLFFFGSATFAVMCAGNTLGALAVYGIFQFFAVLVCWLAVTFYEPLLYGVKLNLETIMRHSPTVNFTMSNYVELYYNHETLTTVFEGFHPADWHYLGSAAVTGLVMLGLALLVYKKRHLEAAGDMISLTPVAPVFLVIYTLCLSAVMYYMAEMFSEELGYFFLAVGFLIGFFTGMMMLEKRTRVFRKKNFLRLAIFSGAFILSFVLAFFDLFGVTRYLPDLAQVESIQVSPYTYEYYNGWSNEAYTTDDPEEMAIVSRLHKTLLEQRNPGDSTINIRYDLKNGTTVVRRYPVDVSSAEGDALRAFYSSPRCVLGAEDVETVLQLADLIEVIPTDEQLPFVYLADGAGIADTMDKHMQESTPTVESYEPFDQSELAKSLLKAIYADCQAGNMAQVWDYHRNADCVAQIYFSTGNTGWRTEYLYINVYSDCENTVEYLKNMLS